MESLSGSGPALSTRRLRLRPWLESDREPFAALCGDPAVMEHFPEPLTRAQSDHFIDRMMAHIPERGWGFWAAERVDTGELIGMIGLNPVSPPMPPAPSVEIGWRIAHAHWGQGFAPEGAQACLEFGFERLGLDEVIAFTTARNDRSQRVMRKLGMVRDPGRDFEDERYPDWPDRRLLVFRIGR